MSRSAEDLLEFDRLKAIVSRFTTCVPGRRAVQSFAPRQDPIVLDAEFALIGEATAYLRTGSEFGFGSLADPTGWLARLVLPGAVLSTGDLLDSATLMESAAAARHTFRVDEARHRRLAERTAGLADFRSLLTALRRAVMPNGEISDDASPKLKRIRLTRAESRERIHQFLEGILRARGEPGSENYITLRNERFVIPVRASERRSVPGVVHAASATGQTVFLEPLDAIDQNNRLVQLAEEEAVEIARVLEELTSRLRDERDSLAQAAAVIAHLDSIFARARFARDFDCAVPQFTTSNRLCLKSARNPVLEETLRGQGREAVPLSLALGNGGISSEPDGTIMVISGPNTGGKTVALKTVGLAALSAQSGLPVAANRAELPIFDRVLADIGDEQSITADLSTFSAHMLNLKSMLETATGNSLILLDEMGTGTEPEEGAALAVALLEEFRERQALTLATTHHDRLKEYASTTPGVVNAAMEFDEGNLRPTYRLLAGVPGMSSGIEIARRLGLPERVIDRARSGLSPESREAHGLIAYLHRSRDEMESAERRLRDELAHLEEERRVLQGEWTERQKKRIAELENGFLRIQKHLESEISRLCTEIKDRALRAQLERQARRASGKILSAARAEADAAVVEALSVSQPDLGTSNENSRKPVPPEQLTAGQRVLIKGFRQAVVFRRRDGRKAEIEAGSLRMKVPVEDILGIEAAAPSATRVFAPGATRQPGITVHAQPSDEAAAEEINVIGCTVEEATARVDKFLDQAALAGRPSVRIIHGYGTGALHRGLSEFLSSHPLVERIHAEAGNRGGRAVTVAELQS